MGCHFLLHFLLQPSLVSRCDPLAGPWAQLQALSSASAVGAGLELPPTLSPQPLAPLRWSWTLPPGPLCLERPLSSHLKQHSSELVLVPSSHWPPCKGRDVGLPASCIGECGVLATGPPGKSQASFGKVFFDWLHSLCWKGQAK